jgi:hypothetical protein
MNISRVAGHGFSNHALHHSGRFEKATINVQDNNLQNVATLFDDSATKVTISPEAQALNETEPPISVDEKIRKYMDRDSLVHTWLREIQAEAYKNGTSMKAACRKYGREIAEDLVDKKLDNPSEETLKKRDAIKRQRGDYEFSEETLNRFFEGITRYMDGQSYKDAFNLNEQDSDYKYGNKENDFLEDKYDELENILRKTREGYYEAKKRGKDIGVIFSFRYECWISPPDNKAIKPDEEDAPQEKSSDKAAPQDKNEIFKDFAEQVIASHHKKKNKASYADFFEKMNHVQNAIKNPKIKNEENSEIKNEDSEAS